jgi:hypothetical protein
MLSNGHSSDLSPKGLFTLTKYVSKLQMAWGLVCGKTQLSKLEEASYKSIQVGFPNQA